MFATVLLGSCEKVGNTVIRTRFLSLGLIPIMPVSSHFYVLGSTVDVEHIPLLYRESVFTGITIKLPFVKSVLLGYIRPCIIAIGILFSGILLVNTLTLMVGNQNSSLRSVLFAAGLAGMTWGLLALSYAYGSLLQPQVRTVREAAFDVLGLSIDPSWLIAREREEIGRILGEICQARKIPPFDAGQSQRYSLKHLQVHLLRLKAEPRADQSRETILTNRINELRNRGHS